MKRTGSLLVMLLLALATACATTASRTDTTQTSPYSYGQPYHGLFGGHR